LKRTVMNEFKSIIERLKINEEIDRKFFEVETEILGTLNFQDLFIRLLSSIREKFDLPLACLSLVETSEISALVKSIVEPRVLEGNVSFVDEKLMAEIFTDKRNAVLLNENLELCYPLFPWISKSLIKSAAVVPLFPDGKLCGSLNQADPTQERFRPGIDSIFLDRLATKLSICLSNVAAHEKLKLMVQKYESIVQP